MGGSKTKTSQQQQQTGTSTFANTSTYDWLTPPETADMQAVRDFKFKGDPRLPYTFARAFQRAKDTYDNPLGGATTPQIRDAVLRATAEDIGQEEGQAYREENFGLQGLNYAQKSDVAQMTSPRLAQTGSSGTGASSGSSTGTSVQTSNPGVLNTVVQGAASAAMIF